MKKIVKASLIVMTILTAIYIGGIVYACTSSNICSGAVYAAFLRDEVPPTVKIHTLEELGIVKVIEYEWSNYVIHVVVGKTKINLRVERPYFEYKGRPYQIAEFHVTVGLPNVPREPLIWWWGAPLFGGWIFTGILFFKRWKMSEKAGDA